MDTTTVAQMIAALSKLDPAAPLKIRLDLYYGGDSPKDELRAVELPKKAESDGSVIIGYVYSQP